MRGVLDDLGVVEHDVWRLEQAGAPEERAPEPGDASPNDRDPLTTCAPVTSAGAATGGFLSDHRPRSERFRAESMLRGRRLDWVDPASRRMQAMLGPAVGAEPSTCTCGLFNRRHPRHSRR